MGGASCNKCEINGNGLSEKVEKNKYFGDIDVDGKLTLNSSYSMVL
jgi:hypothetical protein